jgi:hypothetical protein
MDLNHQKPARKIAAPCRYCGREFFAGKRDGRRRQFCSNACRQAQFRNAEFARRYQVPDPLRNAENTPTNSMASKGKNRGRAFPVDLLGHGYRWPGSEIDSELRRNILAVELGGALREAKR